MFDGSLEQEERQTHPRVINTWVGLFLPQGRGLRQGALFAIMPLALDYLYMIRCDSVYKPVRPVYAPAP